jgi:hypothetical protein
MQRMHIIYNMSKYNMQNGDAEQGETLNDTGKLHHYLRVYKCTRKLWSRGSGFPQLPSAVISTVDHPLGSPSLLILVYLYLWWQVPIEVMEPSYCLKQTVA